MTINVVLKESLTNKGIPLARNNFSFEKRQKELERKKKKEEKQRRKQERGKPPAEENAEHSPEEIELE
ncbi:MAG: hypothetical protein F9K32_12160 [Desulfobulbaceae bacterium]|nr:MAG: hypothetical protein F9K32_12160 [Desulfobulbaceae bacterium]